VKHRLIAFFLPQFHPIPENDEWWGKGFTEWRNVAQARPFFPGHYQPRLPADLGFYDLRLAETREAQASLAREHGIHGFCYYHYWFNGRQVLQRPFAEILRSGSPSLPFCLAWANENWTRTWDGHDSEILLQQFYSAEDDLLHIRSLIPALQDARYIRVGGKPLLIIYRAARLPEPRRTLETWRQEARRAGLGDLYLCRVESLGDERGDPRALGFDAAIEFQPDWLNLGTPLRRSLAWRGAARLGLSPRAYSASWIFDYAAFVERQRRKPAPGFIRYPCVTPSWDNSPRRARGGFLLHGSRPELYEEWLRETLRAFVPPTPDENLVFINAWNEWAEGAALEPCRRFGRGYLEATRRASGG
jgi:lipopolysaccharide biosynthesis protein